MRPLLFLFVLLLVPASLYGQVSLKKELSLKTEGTVEIANSYGRVSIEADDSLDSKILLTVNSAKALSESELSISSGGSKVGIDVEPRDMNARIDILVKVPSRTRMVVETRDGEVRLEGNLRSASVTTYSGTISTNIPLDKLKYDFVWTGSRPRYLSDVELPKGVEEKAAGKFVLSGELNKEGKKKGDKVEPGRSDEPEDKAGEKVPETKENRKERKALEKQQELEAKKLDKSIELSFSTSRGIVLLNVDQSEVPSDLRERPLTEAARAIIRSGDSIMMEAIRRASPKYFGDYSKTLPPRVAAPSIKTKPGIDDRAKSPIKRVYVKVVDANNRAVSDLTKESFSISEKGAEREVLAVERTNAPFNLVLLLDVSGSIENYVDFIRKAARNFIGAMRQDDKITIVVFNEQVKQLTTFTADRNSLSESLDTFDAGGGTAYYDAVAFCLVDILKPFKNERTAIVVLSDGDDNRSFLPFQALVDSVQEHGSLIYPLYVPSGLIAASANNDPNKSVDPLRTRYMALTTRADEEGARLAHVSGGVYYPITRLEQLQKAYEDISIQLRTAYQITFRSDIEVGPENRVGPRLKVKVNKENTFISIGSIYEVTGAEAQKFQKKETGQVTNP